MNPNRNRPNGQALVELLILVAALLLCLQMLSSSGQTVLKVAKKNLLSKEIKR